MPLPWVGVKDVVAIESCAGFEPATFPNRSPVNLIARLIANLVAFSTGVLTAAAAVAAPMGFEDSWMVMGEQSPSWRELWANYALTPRDAVGGGLLTMRSDDRQRTRRFTELTYTHLLKRWNLPNAQANVWLLGGAGSLSGNDFSGGRFAIAPGVQLDYETRRVYVALNARLYRAKQVNHDFASLRVGFSFYETEYDETQPWFVLEARRMRGLSDEIEWTPQLRLINKSFFIDAGVNLQRQGRVSFMYIF